MTEAERKAMFDAMVDLAAISRKYFVELVKQGFDEKQALQMTIAFVNTTLKPQQESAPPSPFSRFGMM